MVFEQLINPLKIKINYLRYWKIFILGFFYASIAIFLSIWVFKAYVSIVMIALTVIASIVLIHSLIIREESYDNSIKKETALLKRHSKITMIFIFLFLGFVVSFASWYIFLPRSISSTVFSVQIETLKSTLITPSGNFVNPSAAFSKIYLNNLKILFFCIIFSFFYGAGALFILTWNASVMGAAIGSFIKNSISNISASVSGASLAGYANPVYFSIAALGLFRYLLHGLPEIIAYFVGALSGGILSVAIVKHDFHTKNFRHTLIDAVDLILISIVILFLAALIEIFITPVVF